MPERHFLNRTVSLSQQVADFLVEADAGDGDALRQLLLITPTSSAARAINRRLTSKGLKPVKCLQPMEALLQETESIATPIERALGWVEALQRTDDSTRKTLFWKKSPETTAELLKASRNFVSLCDQLAEGGHSPESMPLPPSIIGTFEEERWHAVARLYRDYLNTLEHWELRDPNEARLQAIQRPNKTNTRIVIACVSDLPVAFERFIASHEQSGTTCQILIWNPNNRRESDFDSYGRPLPENWLQRPLGLDEAQIHLSASAVDEAEYIASNTAAGGRDLVSIDKKQNAQIASALLAAGKETHLPEGVPLTRSEAARIALGWEEFLQTRDLRLLRTLLESPAFCSAVDTENPLDQTETLSAIDHLLGKSIASSLDDAWAASPALPESANDREKKIRSRVRRLLGSIQERLADTPLDLIQRIFPDNDKRPASATRVLEIAQQLQDSPAAQRWLTKGQSKSLPSQIFAQAIRHEAILSPAKEGAITLNGWLETPWLESEQLLITGATEGNLPQNSDGDPFLPDSIRPFLGLNNNQQRLARDTYLLDAIIASYPLNRLKISLSKYSANGDPNRPSRLLFKTSRADLPKRTLHLIEPQASPRTKPRRNTDWRWRLPKPPKAVEKISPTQFESYLSCPFRFFLEKAMGYDTGPRASREMDAAVYGNLIHKTLENFGIEAIADGPRMLDYTEQHIHNRVQALLHEEAILQFGANPAPAVKVQLANASTRLHAFARIQAECFSQRWKILSVERKLSANDEAPLKIGALKLSGIIDRIEQNEETGALRVMDFKTFSSLKRPADTHLAPPSHNWLPEALIDIDLGRSIKTRTWSNLQLPLYRRILEHWYPEECATHRPETAYFVLPSDPSDSGVYTFGELDESQNPEAYRSAIDCAEAIANEITKGVFWPPQAFRGNWEDPIGPLLVNGKPEECIHPETVEILKGVSQ